jgi:hypothetical protein
MAAADMPWLATPVAAMLPGPAVVASQDMGAVAEPDMAAVIAGAIAVDRYMTVVPATTTDMAQAMVTAPVTVYPSSVG